MSYVYRAFDEAGRLLYVGLADDPEHRIVNQHACNEWTELTACITVEGPFDRAAAVAHELHAIRTEDPVFNRSGRSKLRSGQCQAAYPDRHPDDIDAGAVLAFWQRQDAARFAAVDRPLSYPSPAELEAILSAMDVERRRLTQLVRSAWPRYVARW